VIDIPIKHLFVEYKTCIERAQPYSTVHDELASIARQREHFRTLVQPGKNNALAPVAGFLDTFDTSTAYPLLLHILDAGLSTYERLKWSPRF
jgi:hypothetical protein